VTGGGKPGEWATQPNVQRIPAGGRVIEVQMGSIHAVKGETHFATLVLETHNYKHSLKSLIPWPLEDASGPRDARAKPVGCSRASACACNYVAFTRSTHIICLAIPKTALGEANAITELRA
jgi:DNA helicase-2/ATP-dependent DNA helicase PcrA